MGTAGDSFTVSRQERASGGIIVQVAENQLHIDPGPGSLLMAKLCNINLRANIALIASSSHLYKSNDVNAVIDAMTYAGFDKKGVLLAPERLVNGTETAPPILLPSCKTFLERVIILSPGKRVGLNEIEIDAFDNNHKHYLGLKLKFSEFVIGYSGDANYSPSLADNLKGSNVLILNMEYAEKKPSENGLDIKDATRLITKVRPRLAILTGFGSELIKSDPLYIARDIQRDTDTQVIAAKDGMVIDPLSYSIVSGQRTLLTFSEKPVKIREYAEQPIDEYEEHSRQKTLGDEFSKQSSPEDSQQNSQG